MRMFSWAASDTGKKRDHNEDSFLVDGALELYAVADGMGGHQGGGHASRLALEVLRREIAGTNGDFDAAAARLVGGVRKRKGRDTARVSGDDPTGNVQPRKEDAALEDTLDGVEATPLPEAPPEVRAGGRPAYDTPTEPAPVVVPAAEVIMSFAARKAGHEIFDAAQEDPALQGMGTTLTAVLHKHGHLHYAHAGDSRVYLFRDGKLRQLTEDHSWIWEQIKSGAMSEAEAKISKFRHIITRSVGFERDLDVDTGGIALQAGDCFLLCSDGMSNYVDNEELERILGANWFRRAPRLLIDIANDRGGDDNITVVVVYAANDAG